ncbi:Myb-like DNA-binding domain-containing protein [Priestia megaterium]|uniref:Myb-like DNA-binding domain-containing protein n=1 Tax=Priestia megaterium TaxID=1404 RepID=UPI0015D4A8CE|nr:Myb-like DNA-binding domain-containing protein [Priestia megaterium]
MMARRNWTLEEVFYLREKIGVYSFKAIAKKLDRSIYSVKMKAAKLGIGDPAKNFDGVTQCQLADALNVDYGSINRWIAEYQLPIIRKVFAEEKSVKCINLNDFWQWAEKHKHMLNFARVEKHILGAEPEWVDKKRGADKMNLTKKKKKRAWTVEEDKLLISMVHAFCYTYAEIAQRVQRSEAACKRRLYDLDIKARPVRSQTKIWSEEEERLLVSMYEQGYGLNTIAEKLSRTSLMVRGKMERMGYTFRSEMATRNDQFSEKVL